MREESFAKQHDAVEALEGKLGVVSENFVWLYFLRNVENPEVGRVYHKVYCEYRDTKYQLEAKVQRILGKFFVRETSWAQDVEFWAKWL